jgi:hypothetical protein
MDPPLATGHETAHLTAPNVQSSMFTPPILPERVSMRKPTNPLPFVKLRVFRGLPLGFRIQDAHLLVFQGDLMAIQ